METHLLSLLCDQCNDKMSRFFVICLLFSLFLATSVSCYEVPPAKLEAIYPKGLRVSIPGLFDLLANVSWVYNFFI